jgi:hypothetical protein
MAMAMQRYDAGRITQRPMEHIQGFTRRHWMVILQYCMAQLTLYKNTLTILSACGGFLSSRKSVARGALQPFLPKRPLPPPPQKKCTRGAAPIGL